MYEEIPAERNPVNVHKLFRDKRPQSMLEPDDPFYLTVNRFKSSIQEQQNDCTWFEAQPMRVNKLNSILKDVCEVGEIPRKTNHAGRKPLSQKLQENDVPPNQIIQITGPKKPPVDKQLQRPTRTTNGEHFKHLLEHGVSES